MKFGISPLYFSGKARLSKKDNKERDDDDEVGAEDEEDYDEPPKRKGSRKAGLASKPAPKKGATKKSALRNEEANEGKPEEEGQDYKYITDDPVPPGCAKESERRALREKLDSGAINQTNYNIQFKKLMSEVRKPGTPTRVLEVPLVHGSFVVMHGSMMQKVYQVGQSAH